MPGAALSFDGPRASEVHPPRRSWHELWAYSAYFSCRQLPAPPGSGGLVVAEPGLELRVGRGVGEGCAVADGGGDGDGGVDGGAVGQGAGADAADSEVGEGFEGEVGDDEGVDGDRDGGAELAEVGWAARAGDEDAVGSRFDVGGGAAEGLADRGGLAEPVRVDPGVEEDVGGGRLDRGDLGGVGLRSDEALGGAVLDVDACGLQLGHVRGDEVGVVGVAVLDVDADEGGHGREGPGEREVGVAARAAAVGMPGGHGDAEARGADGLEAGGRERERGGDVPGVGQEQRPVAAVEVGERGHTDCG